MNLLLLSNSTNPGENFLEFAMKHIKKFLGEKSNILFIPFAAVTISYDEYFSAVKNKFQEYNLNIHSIHKTNDFTYAISEADAIIVGGGNTFKLLNIIQKYGLVEVIRNRVLNDDIPYVGWSAGSNLACPTIMTTNDMPVMSIKSFIALNFIPFQINPHYNEMNPPNFGGESRIQRLLEFVEMNPDIYVVGLYEGTAILVEKNKYSYIGNENLKVFKKGERTQSYNCLPSDLIN